jgi:hypothetical protein
MAISNNSTGLRTGVCTSATRPTAPYEGQMIYETDTDMVAIWNGTAWRYLAATTAASGSVLQVAPQGIFSTQTQFTGGTFADLGVNVSITPKSSSSKIMLFGLCNWYSASTNYFVTFNIERNGTQVTVSNNQHTDNATNTSRSTSLIFIDSPATTSALTYKLRINANGHSLYAQHNGAPSILIAMEIAG